MKREITFGMIKSEGLESGLEEEIFRRISRENLGIVKTCKRSLTQEEVEHLYGHLQENLPLIYAQTLEDFTHQNVVLLKIEGEDAVERLLRLRGASNPCEALPGTIRGDYARDQDYRQLRKEGKRARTYFHAADSEEEAKRMISLLFT